MILINQLATLKSPPRIDISVTMRQSEKHENENKEDQNTISTCQYKPSL